MSLTKHTAIFKVFFLIRAHNILRMPEKNLPLHSKKYLWENLCKLKPKHNSRYGKDYCILLLNYLEKVSLFCFAFIYRVRQTMIKESRALGNYTQIIMGVYEMR